MSDLLSATDDVTLLDLLDRVVDKGVVLSGDLTIAVADIDLIYIGLRLLITSVARLDRTRVAYGG